MSTADKRLVGFVFDLDETLAPDTTTQYLITRGVDTAAFWQRVEERMHSGWDQVPAYLYGIIQEGARSGAPVTRTDLSTRASSFALFPGSGGLVSRLREHVSSFGWQSEFYLLSSGLAPIVQRLPIAGDFDGIWTSDFVYDEADIAAFPRRVVSFTDKTRPLIEISKGISQLAAEANPFLVNERVGIEGFRLPFRRMIFVGDGLTDVPCFSLVTTRGGLAVAVFNPLRPGAREAAERFLEEGRVSWVAEADYRPDGAGYRVLCEAFAVIAGDHSERQRRIGPTGRG